MEVQWKERRQKALTKEDIEAIKEAVKCDHACFFPEESRETLMAFAAGTQKVKRITVTMTIVAIVSAVLSGIATGFWVTFKHFINGIK